MATEFNDGVPRFSPDGKWIAYVSNETGRSEVYVRPFREGPARGERQNPGVDRGGDFPAWSRNGNELFFISNDMNLKQVDMRNPGPKRGDIATLLQGLPRDRTERGTGYRSSVGAPL